MKNIFWLIPKKKLMRFLFIHRGIQVIPGMETFFEMLN